MSFTLRGTRDDVQLLKLKLTECVAAFGTRNQARSINAYNTSRDIVLGQDSKNARRLGLTKTDKLIGRSVTKSSVIDLQKALDYYTAVDDILAYL